MKINTLQGSSFDVGFLHGKIIAGNFDKAFKLLKTSDFYRLTNKNFPYNIFKNFRSYCLITGIKRELRYFPELNSYLDGILSVKEMSFSKLFFTVLVEVLSGDRRGILKAAGCSGLITDICGCLVVGKNFDFQYIFSEFQGVTIRKQKGFLSYLSLAPILMPLGGQFNMNESGLVVSHNLAYSCKGVRFKGIPVSFLSHEILTNCRTAKEAIKHLKKLKCSVNSGASILIADTDTGFLVEMEGKNIESRELENTLANTNHFQLERLKELNFSDKFIFQVNDPALDGKNANHSSKIRLSKLRLGSKQKMRNVEELKNLLSENEDEEGMHNIFQKSKFWGTISTAIAVPKDKRILYYSENESNPPVILDVKALLQSSTGS